MSDEIRTLPVALSEITAADKAVEALFREGDNENALRLGAMVLKWRSMGMPTFACSADDIDESAGMAEVVELHGYSRKLPGDARRAPCQ